MLDPVYEDIILHLSQPRTSLDGRMVNARANFLVRGPLLGLTDLGTVAPDTATLRAAAADQEARLRQINASAAVDADAPPEARPIFSQTGPAHHAFHQPFEIVIISVYIFVLMSALHILKKVFSVRIVCGDFVP